MTVLYDRISAIRKLSVVPICRRQPLLRFRQIGIIIFDIPPQARGAHRDRHGARGGDAVDAKVPTDERRVRGRAKSCGPGAPMQALKLATMPGASWPATVANAGSPARARISRKPLRREGRCDSACTCSLRAFAQCLRARADGCMRAPGLPCALRLWRVESRCKTRAKRAAGTEAHVHSAVIARSEATKQSRVACAALDCFACARNDGVHC